MTPAVDQLIVVLLATGAVVGALAAVTSRRPLAGAAAAFVSVMSTAAMMSVYLRAPLSGLALVLLQGAIGVALYVFAVATFDDGQRCDAHSRWRWHRLALLIVIIAALVTSLGLLLVADGGRPLQAGISDAAVGQQLATEAVATFSMCGFILLTALIGIFEAMSPAQAVEEGE